MNDQKALELLQEVIRVKSVLGNESEVADIFQREFEKVGIPVERIEYAPGRDNLIATLEGNEPGPVLGLCGHMDVVPVGETAWKHDPFGAEVVDGILHGRGAVDMKSGLVAQVVALIRLKESNAPLKGTLKFIATIGEETSGIGAEQLVREGYAEDLDALVIGEPRDFNVGVAHRGALWPRITTIGKTAHGSMPENGVNAIEQMLLVIEKFKEKIAPTLAEHTDEMVGKSTYSIDVLNSGSGTNVVPDRAVMEIDIRTLHTQNHEDIKQQFTDILNELKEEDPTFNAEIEYFNDLNPLRTDENDRLVKVVKESIDNVVTKEAQIIGKGGYTDASQFILAKKDFPIVICGPGETKYAHQPNECIPVADYHNIIKVYEGIAKNYLS